MSNVCVGFFQTASTAGNRFLPGTCAFPEWFLLVTASSEFVVLGGKQQSQGSSGQPSFMARLSLETQDNESGVAQAEMPPSSAA